MDDPAPGQLVLRFRNHRAGRLVEAVFLAVWLTGWAIGEVVVLVVLAKGLAGFVAGAAGADKGTPLLLVGGFLSLWLFFWTLGGVVALRQLLRLLWAEQRLVLRGHELISLQRLGPLSTTRRWDSRGIQRVYARGQRSGAGGGLVAQMGSRTVVLSDCGGPGQWAEAAEQLQRALAVPGLSAAPEQEPQRLAVELPPGWQCIDDPLGDRLLVPDLRTRRRQAWVMALLTALVGAGVLQLGRASSGNPGLWGLLLVVTAVAALMLWGTLWLGWGRIEWRITPRRLVRQRRFGGRLGEHCEARALELVETSDSDNDHWYDLRAIELSSGTPRRLPQALSLTKVVHDPTVPRQLGLWLARETRVPFHDRVPSEEERREARRRDLEQLQEKLAASGIAGRLSRSLLEGLMRRLVAEAQSPETAVKPRRKPSASDGSAQGENTAGGSGPRSSGGG